MEHGTNFLPNFTLWIQMGIFFATWFVLQVWVFKPYLALLEMRREKTTGLQERALRDGDRAEKLRADYEAFMKEERRKITAWTDEERRKLAEDERQIVQAARTKVGEELQVLRTKAQADLDRARKELLPMVSEYSSQIVSKVLGYKVKVAASAGSESKKASDPEAVVRG